MPTWRATTDAERLWLLGRCPLCGFPGFVHVETDEGPHTCPPGLLDLRGTTSPPAKGRKSGIASPDHAHAVGGGHVRSGASPATGNVAEPQATTDGSSAAAADPPPGTPTR